MKQVLVTGANKGIGLAVVESILREQPGCSVFLGARSLQRGTAARDALLAINPDWSQQLKVLELDVGSDPSVEAAKAVLQKSSGDQPFRLYALVNNAGLGSGELADILNVNVHGIRRTCAAFSPLMEDGARIVNVTSASGPNFVAQCDANRRAFFLNRAITWSRLEALMSQCVQLEDSGWASLGMGSDSRYGLSKACANSYNNYLARQYPHLVVNACTPGFIETDLGREFLAGRSPAEAGMKSPAEGARVILRLLFERPDGSGQYYGSDGLRSPLDRYRAPGSPAYTGD